MKFWEWNIWYKPYDKSGNVALWVLWCLQMMRYIQKNTEFSSDICNHLMIKMFNFMLLTRVLTLYFIISFNDNKKGSARSIQEQSYNNNKFLREFIISWNEVITGTNKWWFTDNNNEVRCNIRVRVWLKKSTDRSVL